MLLLKMAVPQSAGYSFPVEREEFLFITSPFGNRQDPMDATKQQMHKGIDIKTNHEAVLATENGGKVVAVNHNANTAGGKSVTVEYSREDGSKVQCSYLHLSDIAVKVGDVVNATLSGKVVDVGNFDAIHIKAVFGRRTAPNNQVVLPEGLLSAGQMGRMDRRRTVMVRSL